MPLSNPPVQPDSNFKSQISDFKSPQRSLAMQKHITATLVTLTLFATGCTTMVPVFPWKQSLPEASKKDPVVEILGLWQPAEGTGLDGLPARGFAGQLLFFNRGSKSPVKVNGDIRIYVFDDYGSVEDQSTPIDQFDFVEGTWQAHLHVGTLGPSYNVFIPYSRKANKNQAKCSLRVRLKPANGPTVFSEMVAVTLPGPISEQMKRLAEQRSQNIDAQVRDTLGKLNKEREKKAAAEKAKPTKFQTIPLQTSRDASGRTVTRIAEQGEQVAEAPPKGSARINNLERKVDQLVELMTKQTVQPAVNHASDFEKPAIQQVSAESSKQPAEPHPLSFRLKPTKPLAAPSTEAAPRSRPAFETQLEQQEHPLGGVSTEEHPLNGTMPTTNTSTSQTHPLAGFDEAEANLWNTLSFDGPESTSPPATFRDHPLGE